jgi:hypothetical protein
MDIAACRANGYAINSPFAMHNAGWFIANEANKKNFVTECMQAKGYDAVPVEQVPAGEASVPKD